jgi:hypothetical protein
MGKLAPWANDEKAVCEMCGKVHDPRRYAYGFGTSNHWGGYTWHKFCSAECLKKFKNIENRKHEIKWEKERAKKQQGDCFITTAVCGVLQKPDNCPELTKFRRFRDTFMRKTAELRAEVREYYEIAPQICAKINACGKEAASKKYASIWVNSLKSAFDALNCDDTQKAYGIYKKMVTDLRKEFLDS